MIEIVTKAIFEMPEIIFLAFPQVNECNRPLQKSLLIEVICSAYPPVKPNITPLNIRQRIEGVSCLQAKDD